MNEAIELIERKGYATLRDIKDIYKDKYEHIASKLRNMARKQDSNFIYIRLSNKDSQIFFIKRGVRIPELKDKKI
jgi:hypothetical protein